MADVRVTSGGDRRVTSGADVRTVTGGSVIILTLDQQVQETLAAATVVTLSQKVAVTLPAGDILTLYQPVRTNAVELAAGDILTIDQTTRVAVTLAAGDILTLDQSTQATLQAGDVLTLRQVVLTPDQAASTGSDSPYFIVLDGVDITARCARALSITASEGDNRTAQVIYRPPSGTLNITSYQGREITIDRLQDGALVPLFRGHVDVPTYDRYQRTLTMQCTDLRNERIGREEQSRLLTLTGGIYSNVVQQQEATGERYARELMKTVAGSLDYKSDGVLRYKAWALGSPRYSLAAGDIHHREVSMEFATRSEVVNNVSATVEYRWYIKHTFNAATGWSIPTSDLCNSGVCLPELGHAMARKESLQSRVGGNLGGWRITGVSFSEVPRGGWYQKRASPLSTPLGYVTAPWFRDKYAISASLSLVRWVSQAKREVYEINVSAPESADQFGEIEGSEMRFSLESYIDPGVFEQEGCSIGPDDDRRADINEAIEAVQAIAEKEILTGHRRNYAALRYKPSSGRAGNAELLPVEIGDTISAASDEVTVSGFVTEFSHTETADGDRWTDIRLAVSRVDSAVSVTEDWSLPAVPAVYSLNPETLVDNGCVSTAGESDSSIDKSGKMTFTTPTISKGSTDELVGESSKAYPVTIPNDTFAVEVP